MSRPGTWTRSCPSVDRGHFEDSFHVGEIDLAEVAFDGFDGAADQAAGQRGRGAGQS